MFLMRHRIMGGIRKVFDVKLKTLKFNFIRRGNNRVSGGGSAPPSPPLFATARTVFT